MEQAALLGCAQPGRDLATKIEDIFLLDLAQRGDSVVQATAFEQFHGQVILALVFAERVDLGNVRVVHRRRGPRFTRETFDELRLGRHFFAENL